MTQYTMDQYLADSARTAAPTGGIGREAFGNDKQLLHQLLNVKVQGDESDAVKRSLFYKTPNDAINERLTKSSLRTHELNEQIKTLPDDFELSEKDLYFVHAVAGMSSELGEIVEAFVAARAAGQEIDLINMVEEAGDHLWYFAMFLRWAGTNFEMPAQINIDKLKKRYPHQFTTHHAADENRDLDAERQVLEGNAV